MKNHKYIKVKILDLHDGASLWTGAKDLASQGFNQLKEQVETNINIIE